MEEQKINIHTGVINTDADPANMPEGSYFAALNAVPGESMKDKTLLKRERSNRLYINLPGGFKAFGHVYIGSNDAVAAIGDGVSKSQLVLVKNNGTYEVLVDADGLNFREFVDFTYRVRKGCERTVYFCDCNNYVRTINFDDLEQYKINGQWDVGLMDLFRPYKVPCIVSGEVLSTGGNVRYGSYNVSIQYLDQDLNPTVSMYSSHIITVSDANHGYFNFDINPSIGKSISNKSIRITIDGLDQTFPYYRVIIAEASTGTGAANKFWLSYNIRTNSDTFIFDGNTTNFVETTRAEMITQKIAWERASYIDQVESKLILAGLKGAEYDYCNWQKYASKICVEYVVEEVSPEDYLKKGMTSGVWDKTFMGDEVYAAGIVYVDKRGRHHPSFIIPGKPLNKSCANCLGENECDDYEVVLTSEIYAMLGADVNITVFIDVTINGIKETRQVNISRHVSPQDTIITDHIVMYFCEGDEVIIGNLSFINAGDEAVINISAKIRLNEFRLSNALDDDHVYHQWFPDMSFLISEEQYKQVINQHNRINKTNIVYGDGAPSNLRALRTVEGLPRRWQIYNTSKGAGSLAYYQTRDTIYENPLRDCGVDDYWGVDACGNKLEGTPVRHIKLPDRTIEPLFKNGKLRRLGLKFSNIEYPHPDIVGHYIVIAERDKTNRTILDKGMMNPASRLLYQPYGRFVEGFAYWATGNASLKAESSDNNVFTSPKMHLENEHVRGLYVKVENDYTFYDHLLCGVKLEGKGIGLVDTDILVDARLFIHRNTVRPVINNLKINDQYTLNPLTVFEKRDRTIVNNANGTAIGFVETDRTLAKTRNPNEGFCIPFPDDTYVQPHFYIPYVAIKSMADVHPILQNIVFYRAHNCVVTGDTTVFGDTFMARMDFVHQVLRERYKAGNQIFGGIVGRDPVYDALFNAGEFTQMVRDDCMDAIQTNTNFIAFAGELLSVWVESDVEWQLRPSGPSPENSIYKWYGYWDKKDALLLTHFANKIAKKVEGDREIYYELLINPIEEFYLYNFDYRRKNKESAYITLPDTYNCCSKCLEEFPNRVAYSETSFQEEIADHYRVFKANNYRDIPAERGIITDLWRDSNQLFVHTQEGLWNVPYSFQEVVRGGIVTYIGDGGFFAQPPRLMVDADTGTAGSLHRQSTIKTPQGVFFVDEISSTPYIFAGQLKPIGGDHSGWFDRHLKSWFNPKFEELFGIKPPDNLAYNIAAYDESNNRILLTKIDYQFRDGKWGYDGINFIFNGKPINVGDPEGFINRSYTVSYSLDKQGWVSYHSIIPEYYFYNKDRFYLIKESKVYASDGVGYGNFFGKDYPFVIDLPISQGNEDKIVNDLNVNLRAEQQKGEGLIHVDRFFHKVIIYNTWQSSGMMNIEPKDLFRQPPPGSINVARRLNNWTLNDFRDMVVSNDQPIFITEREFLPTDTYVDKEPNPNATSLSKPWHQREYFKDKWLGVRLYFIGDSDTQLIVRSVINSENMAE